MGIGKSMTSEQIKNSIAKMNSLNNMTDAVRNRLWMAEIAYQLAVMNEIMVDRLRVEEHK